LNAGKPGSKAYMVLIIGSKDRSRNPQRPAHPNVWHGAIVPLADRAQLLDRQGRVHARVSVDFAKECGCYLAVPLPSPRVGP
jgi:hypothetical protein